MSIFDLTTLTDMRTTLPRRLSFFQFLSSQDPINYQTQTFQGCLPLVSKKVQIWQQV